MEELKSVLHKMFHHKFSSKACESSRQRPKLSLSLLLTAITIVVGLIDIIYVLITKEQFDRPRGHFFNSTAVVVYLFCSLFVHALVCLGNFMQRSILFIPYLILQGIGLVCLSIVSAAILHDSLIPKYSSNYFGEAFDNFGRAGISLTPTAFGTAFTASELRLLGCGRCNFTTSVLISIVLMHPIVLYIMNLLAFHQLRKKEKEADELKNHSSLSQNQPILTQRTSGNIKLTAQKVFHHNDTNLSNGFGSLSNWSLLLNVIVILVGIIDVIYVYSNRDGFSGIFDSPLPIGLLFSSTLAHGLACLGNFMHRRILFYPYLILQGVGLISSTIASALVVYDFPRNSGSEFLQFFSSAGLSLSPTCLGGVVIVNALHLITARSEFYITTKMLIIFVLMHPIILYVMNSLAFRQIRNSKKAMPRKCKANVVDV